MGEIHKTESLERGEENQIPVTAMEFSAGHYPGLKTPPLILNEIFQMNHPDITKQAYVIFEKLSPGEQSNALFSVELDVNGEKEIMDIKVFKREDGIDYLYLRGWPRSQKYYGEDTEGLDA